MSNTRLPCRNAFFVLMVIVGTTNLSLGEVRIVAPVGLDSREGETSQNASPNTPFRTHSLYAASSFSNLSGPHLLIGAQVRLDELEAEPNEGSFRQQAWRFSTTTQDTLSPIFSNNIGSDETLVFDGPRSERLPADAIGEGPEEFGPPVVFDPPFLYDPSQGNLLLDFETTSGVDKAAILDAEPTDGISTLVGFVRPAPTALFTFDNVLVREFIFIPVALVGDLNGDEVIDVTDVDLLSTAIRQGSVDSKFDLDNSNDVESQDLAYLIETVISTWFGDANLDGEFNSGDLVAVFQAGHYEDGIAMNTGWSEGDWNGNGDFESGDLVVAFQNGGYEAGPRAAAAVPEPTSLTVLLAGLLAITILRRIR